MASGLGQRAVRPRRDLVPFAGNFRRTDALLPCFFPEREREVLLACALALDRCLASSLGSEWSLPASEEQYSQKQSP